MNDFLASKVTCTLESMSTLNQKSAYLADTAGLVGLVLDVCLGRPLKLKVQTGHGGCAAQVWLYLGNFRCI